MSADLLRRLIEAGTSAELVADVAEALADARAAQRILDERRERDRLRKAGKSTDSAESAESPSPLTPPLKVSPDPFKKTPPISPQPTPPAPKSNEVRPEHVIEAWNLMADQSGVHKAKLTDDRRRKLQTFIRRHSIDDITEAIWRVPASPFLCGENDRGWRAGIDFILQPSSFTKLIEGTYDRATH